MSDLISRQQPVARDTNVLSNDTISRQAAIDFIDAGHLVNPNEPRWSDNEAVNFLKSRPSAQPERTGKWTYVTDGYVDYFRCDRCGKPVFADTPYCPNCGARMETVQGL